MYGISAQHFYGKHHFNRLHRRASKQCPLNSKNLEISGDHHLCKLAIVNPPIVVRVEEADKALDCLRLNLHPHLRHALPEFVPLYRAVLVPVQLAKRLNDLGFRV